MEILYCSRMASKDDIIADLRKLVATQAARIEELMRCNARQAAQIEKQAFEIEKLSQKVGQLELKLAKALQELCQQFRHAQRCFAMLLQKQVKLLPCHLHFQYLQILKDLLAVVGRFGHLVRLYCGDLIVFDTPGSCELLRGSIP